MILRTITIPLRDNPHDDMSSIEKEDNDTWSKKDGSDYSGRGSGEDGKKGNARTIWEDDKIKRVSIIRSTENGDIQIHSDDLLYLMKFTDNTGKKFWKCEWCTMTFQQWNATKALFHVSKVRGGDVRPCKAVIDEEHKERYKSYMAKYEEHKRLSQSFEQSRKRSSDEYLAEAGKAYGASRAKKGNHADISTTSSLSESFSGTPFHLRKGNHVAFSPTDSTGSYVTETNKRPKMHQLTIGQSVDPHHDHQLTMAIADLIHSCGLSFSLASHHKFQRVLSHAKNASKTFTPPGRNKVGGELLELNYQVYKKRIMEGLEKEVDVYGIAYFGDAATIKKAPFINVMASTVYQPVACLRIVNCTEQLQNGKKKDAEYISGLFHEHIAAMEEKFPKSTDVIIFDGATNVQNAGRLMEARYPHISVLHGAEHVVSLFFHDVFNLPTFALLKRLNRLIYKYFGNGSMQGPYAIFSKHSKEYNNGRNIGFIKAADTRMAGHVISMMRTLRLKDALISTVSSAPFIQAKFKVSAKKTQ